LLRFHSTYAIRSIFLAASINSWEEIVYLLGINFALTCNLNISYYYYFKHHVKYTVYNDAFKQ